MAKDSDIAAIGEALLGWYDVNARVLPWRAGPAGTRSGARPDPYRVWLSEIMLQQTTVAAVTGYFHRFTTRWPTVADLAAAGDSEVMAEWAGLGYYARARNLLKCARTVVTRHGGRFPEDEASLRALPGIGPYTAAAIAAIAFDRPATVVDGNVERVVTRLFAVETPLPAARPELNALAARLTPHRRPGDHAQAMMDLGATVCTPRSPACAVCPLAAFCAGRAAGRAADLPRRAPRGEKPLRQGIAYVVRRADGAFLLERRPERGLLGGMLGWPGTGWTAEPPADHPPVSARWVEAETPIRHSFTHFHLLLTVRTAEVPLGTNAERGFFLPAHEVRPADLPTVMRKVLDVASGRFGAVERPRRGRYDPARPGKERP